MIKRKQVCYYSAECDGGCGWIIGWDLKHEDGFKKKELMQVLERDGWKRKGKKWYCPGCQKLMAIKCAKCGKKFELETKYPYPEVYSTVEGYVQFYNWKKRKDKYYCNKCK